jgi:N-hydroxyarylamine O-acetyltransferase
VQVKDYLKRIGIEKVREPSPEFLAYLQNSHLLSIPFEDLDIPFRRIELDLNKIYDKIVRSKRGGFCYELNGLFHWLLTSLGFKVDMLSARVYNSQETEFGPEYDHMTLLVHLDKDYLVDVGFGDSCRIPVIVPDGEVQDVSGFYRILHTNGVNYQLQKKTDEDWNPQYSFSTEPRQFNNYREMCNFQQDSPSSHFRTRMLCTIATDAGRITLSNNSLTIIENDKKNKITFESKEEFNFYLKRYFEIEL